MVNNRLEYHVVGFLVAIALLALSSCCNCGDNTRNNAQSPSIKKVNFFSDLTPPINVFAKGKMHVVLIDTNNNYITMGSTETDGLGNAISNTFNVGDKLPVHMVSHQMHVIDNGQNQQTTEEKQKEN